MITNIADTFSIRAGNDLWVWRQSIFNTQNFWLKISRNMFFSLYLFLSTVQPHWTRKHLQPGHYAHHWWGSGHLWYDLCQVQLARSKGKSMLMTSWCHHLWRISIALLPPEDARPPRHWNPVCPTACASMRRKQQKKCLRKSAEATAFPAGTV